MWLGKWLGDKDRWGLEIKEIGLLVGAVNQPQALPTRQVTAALKVGEKTHPTCPKAGNKHGALWMTLMSQEGGWYGCRVLTTKMAEENDAQEMALGSMNDADISSLHLCLSVYVWAPSGFPTTPLEMLWTVVIGRIGKPIA